MKQNVSQHLSASVVLCLLLNLVQHLHLLIEGSPTSLGKGLLRGDL